MNSVWIRFLAMLCVVASSTFGAIGPRPPVGGSGGSASATNLTGQALVQATNIAQSVVGTSNANYVLKQNGAANGLSSTNTVLRGVTYFGTNDGGGLYASNSAASSNLAVAAVGRAPFMAFDGLNKRLGVGTNAPQSGLHVVGSSIFGSAGMTDLGSTAIGVGALAGNTVGYDNTAVGASSQQQGTSGDHNTSFGRFSLLRNFIGVENSAFGNNALENNTADANVAFGFTAMLSNTVGQYGVAVGVHAGQGNISGNRSINIGFAAGISNPASTDNINIGYYAGKMQTNGESRNIDIGNDGAPGDFGKIRIGTEGTHTNTYFPLNMIVGATNFVGPAALTLSIPSQAYDSILMNNRTFGQTVSSGVEILQGNTGSFLVYVNGSQSLVINAAGEVSMPQSLNVAGAGGLAVSAGGLTVSGNVGIGTTAPAAKLDVIGNVRQSGTNFATNGFASFATTTNIAILSTGLTNTTGRNFRIVGITGASLAMTVSSTNSFNLGTITVPTHLVLQPGEYITGTSVAVQGSGQTF